MQHYNLLAVVGATASGKTRLGVALARVLQGEIISADSRQVYCGLDLGTGKDLHEYGEVPYHLIDIASPGTEFNLFDFQRHFFLAFTDISSRSRLPILVGGSGMYLDCVLRSYRLAEVPANRVLRAELASLSMDELIARLKGATDRLHNTTDLTDRDRLVRAIEIAEAPAAREDAFPEVRPLVLGIRWERAALRERITARLKERLEAGLVEEVRELLSAGVSHEKLDFLGLEYRYLGRHLKGELSRNDMFQKLNSAIHDFAKKQENWFRRMEKHGTVIHWVEGAGDPLSEALALIERLDVDPEPPRSSTP
ncbi:tRNA (adenosine(37)-N6)-dimethylallyltransferase MiaA [Geomonas sp. RF6]|uniref:tRNA (adenosine(37)-N6)-dimethylallyltransferase MiaA n=1 Tax=Geomonas sp. RF6 TaxID=2897342 RepID=UPI001E367B89|nr:tRNA (adenosine(37)-N6)-dimethylallyltransferase MiaA [Geomonas sp. RF6]UFS71287.1 tRNA (adenosine(37)-N6)-dimethylallyltransferase MiaA [Geomonas sp. RF6]